MGCGIGGARGFALPVVRVGLLAFVQRKLITETTFRLIGGTGERSYTDESLPFGVDGVQYIVTAQRGQVQGPASLPLGVFFGSIGGRSGGVRITEGDVTIGSAKAAA